MTRGAKYEARYPNHGEHEHASLHSFSPTNPALTWLRRQEGIKGFETRTGKKHSERLSPERRRYLKAFKQWASDNLLDRRVVTFDVAVMWFEYQTLNDKSRVDYNTRMAKMENS